MQGDFADAQSREGESNSPRSTHFSPLWDAFLSCLDFCPNPLRRFLARIPLRRKFSERSSKHFVQALLHVGFASATRQPRGNSVGFRLVLVLRCAGKSCITSQSRRQRSTSWNRQSAMFILSFCCHTPFSAVWPCYRAWRSACPCPRRGSPGYSIGAASFVRWWR